MVKVFILELSKEIDPDFDQIKDGILKLLPFLEKEKILKIKHQQEFSLSLFAHYLKYLKVDKNNKKEIQYNISHSHEKAVLGISNGPIGIDIEMIDENLINYDYIGAEDREIIKNVPYKERSKYFFKIWSMKESFIKFHRNIQLEKIAKINILTVTEGWDFDGVYTKSFENLVPGYSFALSIQNQDSIESLEIEYVSLKDIKHYLDIC